MKNQFLLSSLFLAGLFFSVSCHRSNTSPAANTTRASETQSVELFGIDVSHHQDTIDWLAIDPQMIAFTFIKATGGQDYTDPMFSFNWENSGKTGIKRGAYHFYYTADTPEKQAAFFLQTIGKPGENDLPPVLDIETHSVDSETNPEQFQKDILIWLETVEKEMHKRPIIYTSNTFAQKYILDTVFSKYHLWIAEYEVDTPRIPDIWSEVKWKFWQNSSSDTINGIKKEVDHNLFKGNLDDLNGL